MASILPYHLIILIVVGCFHAGAAAAQSTPDTLQTEVRGEEIVIGLDSMLRQYAQMRRVEEAGVVGGVQDGLQRMEIDGLVVDETQTKLGQDFYAGFYSYWQPPEGAINYTITVQEQPMPNIGTRVIVSVNDEVAFQTQLQPREDVVDGAARQAVFFTHRFVQGLSSREQYVY